MAANDHDHNDEEDGDNEQEEDNVNDHVGNDGRPVFSLLRQ